MTAAVAVGAAVGTFAADAVGYAAFRVASACTASVLIQVAVSDISALVKPSSLILQPHLTTWMEKSPLAQLVWKPLSPLSLTKTASTV